MPTARRVLALLLAAAAIPACRGDNAATASRIAVDTVAGVEHVRSEGELPAWTAKRIASIGSADETGAATPQTFGRISSVLADAAGNVYVAEPQAHEVRVFAPDGRHLRTMGRKGAGPGEFGEVQSLAWLGDTLAVLDPRYARISLHGRDGAHRGTWAHQPVSGSPAEIRLFRAGSAEAYAVTLARDTGNARMGLMRLTPAGPADTLPMPADGGTGQETTMVCQRPDGGVSFFASPFAPRLVFEPGPAGRIAVSTGDAYRVVLVGARGDTVRVIERAQAPVPVSDAEWDDATEGLRAFRRDFPGVACQPRDLTRPAAKQPVQQIVFSPAGEMWVEVVTPGGTVWEVFGRDGRPLGAFPAPPRRSGVVPYIRDNRLYLVRNDSLAVPFVDVYHVRRTGEPA